MYAKYLLVIIICLLALGCISKGQETITFGSVVASAWSGKEFIVWDGVNGFAYKPVTNSWSRLPKNPYHGNIHYPKLIYYNDDKILAGYWDRQNRNTLCLDYYYSDTQQWQRIKTLNISEFITINDPNRYGFSLRMIKMNANAIICLGSSDHSLNFTCLKIGEDNKISFLPTENAPKATLGMALQSYDKKLLLFNNNPWIKFWSFWDESTNQWQGAQRFDFYIPSEFAYALADDELYVFGGNWRPSWCDTRKEGWIYSFTDNTWRKWPLGEDAPQGRERHCMCWTGKEIIVWGGFHYQDPEKPDLYTLFTGGIMGADYLNDGFSFNPSDGTWEALPLKNAPPHRASCDCIWTGKEMILWGGYDYTKYQYVYDGYAYNPEKKIWRKLPSLPRIGNN